MPSMHAQVSQVSEVSEASADGSAKEAGSGQQCRKPAFTPLRSSQVRRSSSSKRRTKKAEMNGISFRRFETCLSTKVENPTASCRDSSREAMLPA